MSTKSVAIGAAHRRRPPRHGLIGRVLTMLEVRRTRTALSRLNDSQLCDIGLRRDQVDAEIQRPIWDVPQNWRR